MGETCSTRGRDDETRTKSWPENLKGRDHSEHLRVDRRIILEWILGK